MAPTKKATSQTAALSGLQMQKDRQRGQKYAERPS